MSEADETTREPLPQGGDNSAAEASLETSPAAFDPQALALAAGIAPEDVWKPLGELEGIEAKRALLARQMIAGALKAGRSPSDPVFAGLASMAVAGKMPGMGLAMVEALLAEAQRTVGDLFGEGGSVSPEGDV